jgi:glycosyltransferase involved in cell wall biosynthesis
MLLLVSMPKEKIEQKTQKAKEYILANYKWQHCAKRLLDIVSEIKSMPIFNDKKINLGWISTYNTKCGIATYSEFLLEYFNKEKFDVKVLANYAQDFIDDAKEENVIRCFRDRKDADVALLKEHIKQSALESVVINFNFAFFSMQNLQDLLEYLHQNGIKASIIFHSVKDVEIKGLESSLGWIKETLQKVEHLFVHNIEDLNILKSFGLVKNVTLFPHGVQKRESRSQMDKTKKVIASYGFMLPHKGIKELIEAFALLLKKEKNVELLLVNALYPNPVSNQYAKECEQKIEELGISKSVTMITDFLSDDASFEHLYTADMLVMPYRDTQESSSAAVRYAIATNRPVVCTPIGIFNDVADIVHFFQDSSVQSMAQKLKELLKDEKTLYAKNEVQKRWIDEHDWKEVSKRLQTILSL